MWLSKSTYHWRRHKLKNLPYHYYVFYNIAVHSLGSLIFIAQPTGSLVSGFLQNRLGRKTCLMMVNIPQFISWVILYFATTAVHLFLAVTLMGLSFGFLEAPLLSYVGEVTQPRLRGVFSCFAGVFFNLGFMIESILGACLPWRTMVLYSTLGPIIAFVTMALLPDSPAWLVTKGRVKDAEKAFQWLRGWVSPEMVKEELDTLVCYVQETQGKSKYFQNTEYNLVVNDQGNSQPERKPNPGWRSLLEPEALIAFRVILSYFFITSCATLYGMRPFFVEVLENLNSSIRPFTVVAICGALKLLGSLGMCLAMKPLGKRGITFLSLGLSVCCCYGIGAYLLTRANIPWIPVILFFISYFSATLGIGSVPWILNAELFPLRAKSMGSAICAAMSYFFSFVVTKTYFNVVSWVNVSGTCILYGTISLLGLVYLYVDLPETEGHALEAIERNLSERRFFAAMGFSITNANIGLITAMPTIIIGALRSEVSSALWLTETQASWFGSLIFIAQPTGSLVSGFLQNRLGRKTCLMMVNIPQFISWVILYFATTVVHLFFAVTLMGLSVGFLEAPLLSYVGEVTQPRLRGVFSCFAGVFFNLGFMVESILGAFLPWRTMVLYSTLGPIIAFVTMALLPDSPAWLVTKGRVKDAEKAFQWLRGWVSPEMVKEELDTLVCYVQETQGKSKFFQNTEYNLVVNDQGNSQPERKPNPGWRSLLEPEVLIAFRVILSYFFITSCATLYGMRPFFVEVLENLNSSIRPFTVVAICGALQLLGSLGMCLAMKPLGKRGITFLSLGLSVCCCYGIGAYLLTGANIPWIPVILFFISYFSASLGIGAVPWILTAELFPLRAKSMGSAICAAMSYFFSFVVTKTYFNVVSWVNVSGTCILYGTISLLGLVYLYVDLPETEGHALEAIERNLSERRVSRKSISQNLQAGR
ncbi:uncharacterized protein LOC128989036 [Macrosteles quadrilineatus]|uniref:uncharacterized protein LOC128989036 n=1 Tax=Macrosteles quadrilineatus TaxID=74068 RepID=UPI0023E19B25|nr:uncharacterized protein LOC128989036 [Macrosteles quadrilineatus]